MLQHGDTTVRCPNATSFGKPVDPSHKHHRCSGELFAHRGAPRTKGKSIENSAGISGDVEWTIHCPDCKSYLPMRGSMSGTNLSDWSWLTDELLDREEAAQERARVAARTWRRIISRLVGNVWRTLRYCVVSAWAKLSVRRL